MSGYDSADDDVNRKRSETAPPDTCGSGGDGSSCCGFVLPRHLTFGSDDTVETENIKAHFRQGGRLSVSDALEIICRCAMVLKQEQNIVYLQGSVVVCGDLHGQFHDLLTLLEVGGHPSVQQYVFLGDYVDRGEFSTEIVLLCMAYKIVYPRSFILLRGNHESRHLTSCFNFKQEVEVKYSLAVYDEIMAAFDCLPLSCVVDGKFFCVHAGLSPLLSRIGDINFINRFRETPSSGLMCDLLWSDPMTDQAAQGLPPPEELFAFNTRRGCSYNYSHDAICRFLEENDLYTMIRGHETQSEGYRLYRHTKRGIPAVVCVFSASNYCGTYGNFGAVVVLNGNVMNIRQYMTNARPMCRSKAAHPEGTPPPLLMRKTLEAWCKVSDDGYGATEVSGDGVASRDEARNKSSVLQEKLADMVCAMHHLTM